MRVSLFLAAAAATASQRANESVDTTVEDLEGKIKDIKQNEESMKKYVPEAYLAKALNQTKSELAALEAKLKDAKLEEQETKETEDEDKKGGTAGTMGTDLLADRDSALAAEAADDDPTVKALEAKLQAARLKAKKAKEAKLEAARLAQEKKEKDEQEEEGYWLPALRLHTALLESASRCLRCKP